MFFRLPHYQLGKFLQFIMVLCLCVVWGTWSPVMAKNIAVYSAKNKVFVSTVSDQLGYQIDREEGNWRLVRFDRPAIPVWVSSKYVNRSNGNVIIAAEGLNARIRPSVHSRIIAIMPAGYESKEIESRNGFIKIYAPQSWPFSIKKNDELNSWALISSKISANASTVEPVVTDESKQPELIAENEKNEIQQVELNQVLDESTALKKQEQESEIIVSKRSDANIDSIEVEPESIVEPKKISSTNANKQYLLAPGDAISLVVFGEDDLSISNVRIPQNGRVSFPLIGSMQVTGKTTKQVEESVSRQLSQGYVKNPRLSISISSYRPIFIRGAVRSTGSFPYSEGLTIAQALALAGGTKNSARTKGVSISRDGETIQTELSVDSLYEVLSGDIITVEEELGVGDEAGFYIYLHGEVKKPGEYAYRRGLTVEKAVVLAGGFTLRASKRKITVSRYIEGQEAPEKMKKVELYLPIKPGDIINVGASWF